MTDLIYKDRLGEIASVRHDARHRWVFFSRMAPDQVVLIKCHDTAHDGRARLSLHSAFKDPTAPADTTPRRASKSAPSPFSKTDRAIRAAGNR